MTAVTFPKPQPKSLLFPLLSALLLSLLLFLVALAVWVVGFELRYAGRVYPGVSVGGVDLSGLTPAEAADRLAKTHTFPQTGRLLLRDGNQSWMATPAQLGYYLDPENSAQAALQVGRAGSWLDQAEAQKQAWMESVDLPPVYIFDGRAAQAYLQTLARQIDTRPIEASLGLNGIEVVVNSGQVGRSVDIPATLAQVETQLNKLQDGVIPLVVTETPPLILDASEQAALAKRILSQPLTLILPDPQGGDPGPWTFSPELLAPMLAVERVRQEDGSERYQVSLSTDRLRETLTGIAPSLERTPVNARFIFNDETDQLEVIQPAVIGRSLDVDASVQAIQEAVAKGEHQAAVSLSLTNPPATDQTPGAELGIVELVHSETSYFRGSSASRIQNIATAASRFHGLLVAPGETFSMAQALGDISLDNGYAEALIIYGDRTIKGVGGGVCQVSTTLFRGVFFAGYPIAERHAHAYRVSYYEQKAGSGINPNFAGLDATVFVPLVDFKFVNDTPYWILMETYVEGASLTWKFYSTGDNRTVEWNTTGLTNVTKPGEAQYRENPDLPKGEVKQVEWATDGAYVSISRTVYRNGAVYLEDRFNTQYQPWPEVFEYGPGTEGMPPGQEGEGEGEATPAPEG